jgi:hypothetical protein
MIHVKCKETKYIIYIYIYIYIYIEEKANIKYTKI